MIYSKFDEEVYEDFLDSLSELTGYPKSMIKNLLDAVMLYTVDLIADDVIQSDLKPTSIEFPAYPLGVIKFSRDLRGKDNDRTFEFVPTREFYDMFFSAFFEGKTPMLEIMRTNFDLEASKLDENNLLRLENLYAKSTGT